MLDNHKAKDFWRTFVNNKPQGVWRNISIKKATNSSLLKDRKVGITCKPNTLGVDHFVKKCVTNPIFFAISNNCTVYHINDVRYDFQIGLGLLLELKVFN